MRARFLGQAADLVSVQEITGDEAGVSLIRHAENAGAWESRGRVAVDYQ